MQIGRVLPRGAGRLVRMGPALSPEAGRRLKWMQYYEEHGREKHGRHHYTFADTGLDAGALREQFRRYQEYFDVPSEPLP